MWSRWKRKRTTTTATATTTTIEPSSQKTLPNEQKYTFDLRQNHFGYNRQEIARKRKTQEERESSQTLQLAHKVLRKRMESDPTIITMMRQRVNLDKTERERQGERKGSIYELPVEIQKN